MSDLLFILVLYNCPKEQSAAYCSLKEICGEEAEESLFIKDNTLQNDCLARAYNMGIDYASQHNKHWIILLDQDTVLTEDYIMAVKQITQQQHNGVFAPVLINDSGVVLSPYYYPQKYGPYWAKSTERREGWAPVAFNSGMLLHIDSINAIEGFNTDYPLDFLDFDTILRLTQNGVAFDTMPVTLKHDLSITHSEYVSLARYQSLLQAEKRFAKQLGWMARCAYMLRLAARAAKWTITKHVYTKETWRALIS